MSKNQNIEELFTIGAFYCVKLKDIFGLQLEPENVPEFESKLKCNPSTKQSYTLEMFRHRLKVESIIKMVACSSHISKDSLVLLKYLGNGQFLEVSTTLVIRLEGFEKFALFDSAIDFNKNYIELKENPFFVKNETILKCTNKQRIIHYLKGKKRLQDFKNYLYLAKNNCILEMQKKMQNIMLQDEFFAYLENELWKYEHDVFTVKSEQIFIGNVRKCTKYEAYAPYGFGNGAVGHISTDDKLYKTNVVFLEITEVGFVDLEELNNIQDYIEMYSCLERGGFRLGGKILSTSAYRLDALFVDKGSLKPYYTDSHCDIPVRELKIQLKNSNKK